MPPQSGTPLQQVLESDDQTVRFNAGLDLVKAGDVAGVPALIEAFEHESMVVRLFHAASALAGLGAPAIPALEAALHDPQPLKRVDAAYTLFQIDPAQIDRLLPIAVETLEHGGEEAAKDALFFLGEAGPSARRVVPALLAALRQPIDLEDTEAWAGDRHVLTAALLAKIGEPIEDIVPGLIDALGAELPSTRWGAARALGELGAPAEAAIPALVAMLANEQEAETARVEAAYTLAVIADPRTTALPALLGALDSSDWWVRLFATRILGQIGSRGSEMRDSAVWGWIDKAFFGLREIRRMAEPSPELVQGLIARLEDDHVDVRCNAVWALSKLGEHALPAVDALAALLPARDTGPVAAEALALIGDAAVPALRTGLAHHDDCARSHAAYGLKSLGSPGALDLLASAAPSVEPFVPAVHHFYKQVSVTLDERRVAAFEELYRTTLDRGQNGLVEYTLPFPKHEFLRYLVEHKGMMLHGSAKTDIDILKAIRYSTDAADSGNVSGIYADRDPVRPIYFAVVHRGRCFGLNNGFFDLKDDGTPAFGEHYQNWERRFYRLTIGVNGIRRNPWRNGMIYVLPPDSFELWNEWTSRVPVVPVLRVPVEPRDLPLRDDVWGVDWRIGRELWTDPRNPFPFLYDIRATPVHPAGHAPWE